MSQYLVTRPYREPKKYKTFSGARNALVGQAKKERDRARVLGHVDLVSSWDRTIEWLMSLDQDGGKVRVPMPTIDGARIMYHVKIERVD